MANKQMVQIPELPTEEIDDGILGVVLVLWNAGVRTFSSCQGGGHGWGHGYLRPTVCFDGDEKEGGRAERIATEAGYQVFQINRTWYTRDGETVGPYWEMEFVAGAACRAPKDRERIAHLESANEALVEALTEMVKTHEFRGQRAVCLCDVHERSVAALEQARRKG